MGTPDAISEYADLAAEQRRIVELLSAGSTVTEAAGALGISVRMAHRRLAEARARLDLSANSQLVVVAARARTSGRPG